MSAREHHVARQAPDWSARAQRFRRLDEPADTHGAYVGVDYCQEGADVTVYSVTHPNGTTERLYTQSEVDEATRASTERAVFWVSITWTVVLGALFGTLLALGH